MESFELPLLAGIPGPDPRNLTLRVDRSAERALRKGHPWLFADGIRQQSHEGSAGDFAVVFDRRRNFLAIGLYDPDSPIRVRVLHSGKPTPIDEAFFAARLAALASVRAKLFAGRPDTDGYRLVNGENEGMPGLVVDHYAGTLVLKLYTSAWLPHLRTVLQQLLRLRQAERAIVRWSRAAAAAGGVAGLPDGALVYGPELTAPLRFRENGLLFECDPRRGQKTGFFLDQRDNRARVEKLAEGRSVLNVFSYTGGFSLYAARGGATSVVSLDASEPALQVAKRNFALNSHVAPVARAQHEIVNADAFRALAELAAEQRSFDLVIVDPPSFARRQADVPAALAAYARLLKLAMRVLRPAGTLVFASCSARVAAEDFFHCIHREARRLGRPLREIERTGHPADHPVGFPEGAYLKCLFADAP